MENSHAVVEDCTFTNIHSNTLYMTDNSEIIFLKNEVYNIGTLIPYYQNDSYNGNFTNLREGISNEAQINENVAN